MLQGGTETNGQGAEESSKGHKGQCEEEMTDDDLDDHSVLEPETCQGNRFQKERGDSMISQLEALTDEAPDPRGTDISLSETVSAAH